MSRVPFLQGEDTTYCGLCLGEKGYDEIFGDLPLRRVIQDKVEDKLSEVLLRGKFREGDTIVVDREGEEIVVHPVAVGALLGDNKPLDY